MGWQSQLKLPDWIRELLQVRAEFVHPHDRSRSWFVDESDLPAPRTMAAAAAWIDNHSRHHDRFFLFVEEFDPHEPFDTAEPSASRYDDEWDVAQDGPRLVWRPYGTDVIANGYLSVREAATRANHGSKLSMIDHWFGRPSTRSRRPVAASVMLAVGSW
ncbi:MAG: hypothetical protein ABIQ73_18845 [Acidimicrobiales bacterium]